jgi:hypothetical protein
MSRHPSAVVKNSGGLTLRRIKMLFLQPIMLAGAFNVTKGMMLSDPAYEQYVKDSGIDGRTDWHVDDMYSCGGPPCSMGWDFPTVCGSCS